MGITAADIAAMRRDGSFKEFLEHQMAAGRVQPAPAAPEAAPDREPGHRPGAWPTGTRPPSPAPELPAAAWEQAVHDYRAWVAAGQPEGDFTCECGCTPAGQHRREAS